MLGSELFKGEVVLQVAGGLEAVVGVFGEALLDYAVEGFLRDLGWRGGEYGGDDFGGCVGLECLCSGEEFVEDAAEGEDVGAGVGGFGLELFGGHVLEGPEDLAF